MARDPRITVHTDLDELRARVEQTRDESAKAHEQVNVRVAAIMADLQGMKDDIHEIRKRLDELMEFRSRLNGGWIAVGVMAIVFVNFSSLVLTIIQVLSK